MFTDFSNRLTYFGSLDDVVQRYPWDAEFDLASLRRRMVLAAIYDKKVLINDGYLIANSLISGDITGDFSSSLFGCMLTAGSARLFARGGKLKNIAAGIENSASKGVLSHQKIVTASDWKKTGDQLALLSRNIESLTIAWPDKNMGELFFKLVQLLAGSPDSMRERMIGPESVKTFDAIYAKFRDLDPPYYGARSYWETLCWNELEKSDPDPLALANIGSVAGIRGAYSNYDQIRSLMNIANEVYHIAYTIGAGHAIAEKPVEGIDAAHVAVDTALVTAFPTLIGAEDIDPADLPDGAGDRRRLAELSQLLITIPADLRFKDDFNFIRSFTSDPNCREARQDYVQMLKLFIDERKPYAECVKIRDHYIACLSKLMAKSVETTFVYEIAKGLVSKAIGPLVDLPIALAQNFDPTGGKWFGLMINRTSGYERASTRIFERLLRFRVSASLRQDGIAALQSGTELTLARKLGFYMGPIKPEGLRAAMDPIGPAPG